MLKLYGTFIAVMSLAGFLLMGLDKLLAKWNRRRIPEKTLLWVGALGGAPGAWVAMTLFRHKTRHRAFSLGLPILTVLHGALLMAILYLGSKGGLE